MSESEKAGRRRSGMPGWAKLFLVGGLLVVGLPCAMTWLVFRAWEQDGPSMAPNLPDGTGFFASRFGTPEPGDVVVIEGPDGRDIVKRVIAVGGQTVEIVGGVPRVDGVPLERQLVGPATPPESGARCYAEKLGPTAWLVLEDDDAPQSAVPPVTVPPGQLYVLGDYRTHSNDSRYFGPLPADDVEGLLAWVYRPGLEADTPECLAPEP